MVYKYLPANQNAITGELYDDLGLPNLVTYWRGFLVACTTGFLLLPRPQGVLVWLPGLLFTLGILPDYLDGYLARVAGRSTQLGESLDVAVDGLAVMTGTIMAVLWGQLPTWYLLVGAARYLYLFGLWMRRRLNKPVYALPPSMGRRALAGVQMGFLMVMLWPLFGPPGSTVAAYLFGVPFLINFTRDWLFASGMINYDPTISSRFSQQPVIVWLAVILRLVVVVGLGSFTLSWILNFPAQIESFASLGVALPGLLTSLIVLLEVVVVVCTAVGVMVRTMSILAVCLAGLTMQLASGPVLVAVVVAIAAVLLLYAGSGKYSLWTPEDELLLRRAGEEK